MNSWNKEGYNNTRQFSNIIWNFRKCHFQMIKQSMNWNFRNFNSRSSNFGCFTNCSSSIIATIIAKKFILIFDGLLNWTWNETFFYSLNRHLASVKLTFFLDFAFLIHNKTNRTRHLSLRKLHSTIRLDKHPKWILHIGTSKIQISKSSNFCILFNGNILIYLHTLDVGRENVIRTKFAEYCGPFLRNRNFRISNVNP